MTFRKSIMLVGIAVLKTYHSKRLASELLQVWAKSVFRSSAHHKIGLGTVGTPARHFYVMNGYQVCGYLLDADAMSFQRKHPLYLRHRESEDAVFIYLRGRHFNNEEDVNLTSSISIEPLNVLLKSMDINKSSPAR